MIFWSVSAQPLTALVAAGLGAMSWVGSVCSPSRSTKLADYAASVARTNKRNVAGGAGAGGLLFPMYVVAVDACPRMVCNEMIRLDPIHRRIGALPIV